MVLYILQSDWQFTHAITFYIISIMSSSGHLDKTRVVAFGQMLLVLELCEL